MFVVTSYLTAVILCFITMLCWGSWANTQKMVSKEWGFPLYYWDYSLGIILFSLILGLTLGSSGDSGVPFIRNLYQSQFDSIGFALLGGIIFNIANLLLVTAIDIAGMAIAFPIGIGIALVQGVLINYLAVPDGNPILLFSGVALVALAIIADAIAYKNISNRKSPIKGILLSICAGILMGFFYRFVAASMSKNFDVIDVGKLTPYTATFIFAVGIFISNFLFNTIFMYKPLSGVPVSYSDYFKKGNTKLHLIGILGGAIWCMGMELNTIAAGKAGFAISYGLGQGATMVAALWGVFIWKEFKNAPKATNALIALMFFLFLSGLTLIILAKI